MPKEYKTIEISTYGKQEKLAELTTTTCNEMLQKGFVYVGTIASIQQISTVLLFAKY